MDNFSVGLHNTDVHNFVDKMFTTPLEQIVNNQNVDKVKLDKNSLQNLVYSADDIKMDPCYSKDPGAVPGRGTGRAHIGKEV